MKRLEIRFAKLQVDLRDQK